MKRLSLWIALATLAGLALGLWVLGRVGLGEVLGVVGRIGVGGFLLYAASQALVMAALGAAWAWAAPGLRPVALFAWARTVREAANELLPFSQLGGIVVGLRVVLASGLDPATVYAATVIDSLTEIASQLVYVLLGLAIVGLLVAHADPGGVTTAAWAGLGVLALLAVSLAVAQRPLLRLAGRVAGRFAPGAGAMIGEVERTLSDLARRPGALVASFTANLAAWLFAAGTTWLALRLFGLPTPYLHVVAMEAMISVVKSAGFLIPGALGAQEAGYAAIAPLIGLPAEAGLAVSLLKRARELVIGIPALLIWQADEARRGSKRTA